MKYKWTIEIDIPSGCCSDSEIACAISQAQDAFFQSFYTYDIDFSITEDELTESKLTKTTKKGTQ